MKLGEKWKAFIGIILDPWVIMLLLLTVTLGYVSTFVVPTGQAEEAIVAVVSLLFGIFAGVLGGVVAKRWDDLTGERVLVARGGVAIRSLTLLVNNITALRRRVDDYLQRHTEEGYRKKVTAEVIQTYLEEVIDRCKLLENDTLSSIDNWKDVIPEADVKSQAAVITEFEQKQVVLLEQIASLKSELDSTKARSEKEAQKLIARLQRTREELAEARRRRLESDPLGVGAAASGTAIRDLPADIADAVASWTYRERPTEQYLTVMVSDESLTPQTIESGRVLKKDKSEEDTEERKDKSEEDS
jgi:hypothetical protein